MFGFLHDEYRPMRWLAVLLLCLLGCQSVEDVSDKEHQAHEHFPLHWPETIFIASDRLSELVNLTDEPSSTDNPAPQLQHVSGSQIQPLQEFVDLVGWLPILAADSDMDRATFDRIDTAATLLQSKWQKSMPPDLQTLANDPETREMLRCLDDCCRKEQARIQPHFHSP